MYREFETEGWIENDKAIDGSHGYKVTVKPHDSGTLAGVVMEIEIDTNDWVYITREQAKQFFGFKE